MTRKTKKQFENVYDLSIKKHDLIMNNVPINNSLMYHGVTNAHLVDFSW